MESFDAIVVAGGPAAGMRVLVLDRKLFPRDKVCAGWVTPGVLAATEVDPEDYARGRIFQPIRAFRTGVVGSEPLLTRYPEPVSYGIRRCEFDDYLLQRSGARLALGEALSSIARVDGQWELNGSYRAPLLIGAGGHYCPVARHLGADLGRGEQPVTAQEVEFALTDAQQARCAVEAETPELYFSRDLGGYGWCFRKNGWLNIGLGREGAGMLGTHLNAFVDWLRREGRIPHDIPARFHGHAYLLHRRPTPRRRIGDGVLLIGDAAGLAYAQSGEGIRPAVESARLAAQAVAAADGDYGRARLSAYESAIKRRLGNGEPEPWLPSTVRRFIGHRLLASPLLTRKLVLDRWFLHRHQAAL